MSLFGKKDYKQLGRQEEEKHNYAQALKYYEKALQNGDASVYIHMGNIYKSGENGVNKDEKEALRFYTDGANMGDIFCQIQLAAEYINGEICNVDVDKAFEILKTASSQGDNKAAERLNSLSAMIEDGSLAKKYGDFAMQYYKANQYEHAQSYAEAGGKLGDRNSMVILGEIYKNGKNGETDYDKAVYWSGKAAESGESAELYNLAFLYVRYLSDLENVKKALFLVRKAADSGLEKAKAKLDGFEKVYQLFQRASQEDAEAQKVLAQYYLAENPFEKDEKKYIYWIKKSAENGNAKSQNLLSINYFKGDYIKKDLAKFIFYCYQAARQGERVAMENLALIYKSGMGVHKNIERAIYYYKKAAQAGSEKAQKNMEELYYHDKIIQDAIQGNYAVKIYQGEPDEEIEKIPQLLELTEKGDFYAPHRLAYIYNEAGDIQNLVVLRDFVMEELRKKAEQGDVKAQIELAENYDLGRYKLDKDFDAAIIWYKKAAESGEAEAMDRLASYYKYDRYDLDESYREELYRWWANKALNRYMELWDDEDGEVARNIGDVYKYYLNDHSKAIEWYNKAIEHGCLEANGNLGDLYEGEGDYFKAIEYYKKRIDVKDGFYVSSLAKLYAKELNDKESALKCLKMGIENIWEVDCYDFYKDCDLLSRWLPLKGRERGYWLLKSADDDRSREKELQEYIEWMKNNEICE